MLTRTTKVIKDNDKSILFHDGKMIQSSDELKIVIAGLKKNINNVFSWMFEMNGARLKQWFADKQKLDALAKIDREGKLMSLKEVKKEIKRLDLERKRYVACMSKISHFNAWVKKGRNEAMLDSSACFLGKARIEQEMSALRCKYDNAKGAYWNRYFGGEKSMLRFCVALLMIAGFTVVCYIILFAFSLLLNWARAWLFASGGDF